MTPRCLALFLGVLLLPTVSFGQATSRQTSAAPAAFGSAPPFKAAPPSSAPMSKETRMQVIRSLEAELVYIRTPFPMGAKGLHLRNGVVTPNGPELQSMIATFGPAAKPGDQARISNILIRDKSIVFEINGGPRKKTKWYQRITVSGSGGETPIAPSDQDANPRGSFVDLQFDHHLPDLKPAELKALLRPVFDFDAKSPLDAYLETVPPKVKEAIKIHQVLVGMNREMVTYSKGRAEKKIREKNGEIEYEEWIYGEPPKDVEFVRLVGDEVVQMKIMKVDGEKIIRTSKEVDLPSPNAAVQGEKAALPDHKPSLRRPGEDEDVDVGLSSGQRRRKPVDLPPSSPPGGPPNFQTGS